MTQQFRRDAARGAAAADARKAAKLAQWWHTRSGLLWQDAAVMGAMGAALLYAASALRTARRASPAAPAAADDAAAEA